MTLRSALDTAEALLAAAGVESPRVDAEWLLAGVTRRPRLQLRLDGGASLTDADLRTFHQLVAERAQRRPLQHLLGTAPFLEHELEVTSAVLVPRPETEGLAQLAIAEARSGAVTRALDFGTGSGCLAIALATHVPGLEVDALDISPAALEIARKNVVRTGMEGRVHLRLGDGFEALRGINCRYGLIVTNPPYIPTAEIETLEPEVRDHDPRLALDGGDDGLIFYRRLAAEARRYLVSGGVLLAEFGDGQGPPIRDLFAFVGGWGTVRLEKDLSGRDRVCIVRVDIQADGAR